QVHSDDHTFCVGIHTSPRLVGASGHDRFARIRHMYGVAVPGASCRAFLCAFPAGSARRKAMYSLRDGATAAASARWLRAPGWTRSRRADQAQENPGAAGLSRVPPGPIASAGQLATLLWPNVDDRQARANLRKVLFVLRMELSVASPSLGLD